MLGGIYLGGFYLGGSYDGAATIVDSYSEANISGGMNLSTSDNQVGQSFTGDGQTIDSVKFYMKKTGTPTGSIHAHLYAHSGTFGTSSIATGTALATSDAFTISTLTTSYQLITFTFSGSNRVQMASGTKYVIAVGDGSLGPSSYVTIGDDTTSPTAAGNASEETGGIWTADAAIDLIFYVYGVPTGGMTTSTQTITGKARITATTTKTQPAKAVILNTITKNQPAIARITITTVKTITAISRITAVTTKTQTAIARITKTTTKTQPAIAKVTATTTKTQTAKANIGQTVTTKTQPAKVRIVHGNTTYSNAVMADTPISYWRMGESSSTVPSGTVLDNTGYSLATTAGTATLSQTGALAGDSDTATYFDGTASAYWSVLDAANFRYGNATGSNWSVEMWIKAGLASQQKDIYVKHPDANNYIQVAQGGTASNGDLYVNFVDILNGGATITVTGLLSDLKYHHVVIVADRSGGTHLLKVYTDGQLAQSTTCNGGNLANSANLQFGQGIINTGNWNGTYDEVAFYGAGSSGSGVLSATRVLAHYQAAFVTTNKTQTAVARIQVITTKTQTAIARVTALTTKTQTAKARITAQSTKTQTAVGRISTTATKTQTAVARITVTTTRTQTGKARITSLTTQTQTGLARIKTVATKTQTSLSRITAITTKNQTAKGNVYGTTTRTQTAKASIASQLPTQRTQPSVARITVVTIKTQTSVARITVTTVKTITAVGRILVVRTKTQTAKANIYGQMIRQILGLSRITNTNTKTITAVANIAAPLSARSVYTNKGIGQAIWAEPTDSTQATWNSPDPADPTGYQ